MRTCRWCSEKFDPKTVPARVCEKREGEKATCEPVPRGFACLTKERVQEIARKGGETAVAAGKTHQFTTDEARAAGRLGGFAPHKRRGPIPKEQRG